MYWVFDLNPDTDEVELARLPGWLFLDDAIRYCNQGWWSSAIYDEYGKIYYAKGCDEVQNEIGD